VFLREVCKKGVKIGTFGHFGQIKSPNKIGREPKIKGLKD